MKYGLKYCPECKDLIEVIYRYPDKSVMLKCDHIVSLKEQKKYKEFSK